MRALDGTIIIYGAIFSQLQKLRPQIALALQARAILLVLQKNYFCLFIPNSTRNHDSFSIFTLQNASQYLTKCSDISNIIMI